MGFAFGFAFALLVEGCVVVCFEPDPDAAFDDGAPSSLFGSTGAFGLDACRIFRFF